MNKKLLRVIALIMALVFCMGLAACKKEGSDGKQGADGSNPAIGEAINKDGDYYEYRASYEKLPIEIENGYMQCGKIINNKLYAIADTHDPKTHEKTASELVIYDLESGEEKRTVLSTEENLDESYIAAASYNEDGTFNVVYSVYRILNNDSYQTEYFIYKFDKEGKGTMMYSLTDLFAGEESTYVNEFVFTKDGGLAFSADTNVYKIGEQGELQGKVSLTTWIKSLFENENGDIYVSYYPPTGYSLALGKVDFSGKSINPAFEGLDPAGYMFPMSDGKYLVTNETGAYSFDPQAKETMQLWTWLNLDMRGYGSEEIICCDDGSFNMINEVYDNSDGHQTYELVTIEKVLVTKENARKEIVIGCLSVNWELENFVINFNKTSTDYRVKVKEYYDYDADYQASLERFHSDVASNPDFDIVILDSFYFEQFAKKGAFEDIGEYLEKDSDYKRSDFFENALDAFTVDGKDYAVIPSVEIMTMFGSKAVFNDKSSWTIEDMLELRKQNPDISFFDYPLREEAFLIPMVFSLNEYVDFESGKCDFNKQSFYDILEFAKTFPEDIDYENYNSWEGMRNGSVIVCEGSLSDLSTFCAYRQLFPEGVTVIGAPAKNGSGNYFMAEAMYSILKSSDLKDECWDFLKKLLKNNTYETMSYSGVPTLKAGFEEYVKQQTKTDTYIDENGVEQIVSIGGMGMDGEYVEIYPPTKEDMELVKKAYETTTETITYDEQLLEIIAEEAEPFFEGQKTASDVANIIQSRLGIYIAENY